MHFYQTMSTMGLHPSPRAFMPASCSCMRDAVELVSSAHLPNSVRCPHYGLLRKDPIKKTKIHSLSLEFWNLEQLAFTEKD